MTFTPECGLLVEGVWLILYIYRYDIYFYVFIYLERKKERFLTNDKGQGTKWFPARTSRFVFPQYPHRKQCPYMELQQQSLITKKCPFKPFFLEGRRSGQYVEQQTTDWYMPMIGESAFLGPPQGLGPWSVLLGRGANPIYLDLFKVIFYFVPW